MNFGMENGVLFPKKDLENTENKIEVKNYTEYDDSQVRTYVSFFLANEHGYDLNTEELVKTIKDKLVEAYNFPENGAVVVDGKYLRVRLPSGEFFQKPLLDKQLDEAA